MAKPIENPDKTSVDPCTMKPIEEDKYTTSSTENIFDKVCYIRSGPRRELSKSRGNIGLAIFKPYIWTISSFTIHQSPSWER